MADINDCEPALREVALRLLAVIEAEDLAGVSIAIDRTNPEVDGQVTVNIVVREWPTVEPVTLTVVPDLAVVCETPGGCTCGAPATTPRGMHHAGCEVRRG